METGNEAAQRALQEAMHHELSVLSSERHAPLPSASNISTSTASIVGQLPEHGLGTEHTTAHLINDIVPGLNGSSLSSTYFGLVTGGATPVAKAADHLTTLYDQNVCLHLPDQSVATIVESKATAMLADLLRLDSKQWPVRLLTTGATAGNILGIACARQWLLESRVAALGRGEKHSSVAEMGLPKACRLAKIEEWQILTSLPHSSLRKAANIVGIGAAAVIDVADSADKLTFDMQKLEEYLAKLNTASIVAISCGEVNTGRFATHSQAEVARLRELCDRHGAWLHVDGAFGIFARCLTDSGPEFSRVASGALGVELADSIAGDGHKMLNVPYDSGFFFNKHLPTQQRVFENAGAAYLSANADDIPSVLNLGLENSRRFRGLPVYANLLACGRKGYAQVVARQVHFARKVVTYLVKHEGYEVLPTTAPEDIFMVVLFRAKDPEKNKTLVHDINQTREMYVSGTVWDGKPAARIAVSNWQTDAERDYQLVVDVLERIVK